MATPGCSPTRERWVTSSGLQSVPRAPVLSPHSPAGLLGTLKGSAGANTPVLDPREDSRLRTPPDEDAREDQDRLLREAGVRVAGSGGRDALGSSVGGWAAPWLCRQDNREKTGCLARLGPALPGATGSRPLSVAAAGCSPGLGSAETQKWVVFPRTQLTGLLGVDKTPLGAAALTQHDSPTTHPTYPAQACFGLGLQLSGRLVSRRSLRVRPPRPMASWRN